MPNRWSKYSVRWSPEALPAARAVETQIREAFKGVSREGGVSWSESYVIDDYGTMDERLAARALDRDTSWQQLVRARHWNRGHGAGGFSFLDAIGFRYYLPAALIQSIRAGHDMDICYHLIVPPPTDRLHEYSVQRCSLLDVHQCRAVAAATRIMIVIDPLARVSGISDWQAALESHWATFEA